MHADMTAVTLHSTKIVSNEVRQLSSTRAILQGKKMNFLANPILVNSSSFIKTLLTEK